ncbi:MAG: UDP-N-acetylmuramoyl-tripeptide--D-alanyl-D-alanine ligase [bacterium]|nr:UDP-N-acetylmuramoyl-tripeptide--D-alanyl-D-alanine ligase [bacterium]MDZ4232126.1 UDP-N-acetylmuramoyl-tripeptide--D-alanyl-D-alanine ligase [Candidatus Pacearchaeota archaeon]
MNQLLFLIWLFLMAKSLLFWLYVWQLKEYHIGRVQDHFGTRAGRSIILNQLVAGKLVLLVIVAVAPALSFLVFFLYSAEAVRIILRKGRVLRPALTIKTLILGTVGAVLVLWYGSEVSAFSHAALWLLFFDLLSPAIFSVLVLAAQPLAVAGRNRILRAAAKKRAKLSHLKVVGITGSYGKTSTKEFASWIIGTKFRVAKTSRHQNSEVGVSYAILRNLKETDEVLVAEMGAYGRGGVKLLCDIARPQIGVLTGISSQHLATFGSQKLITKTKFEIVSSLPKGGTAILNKDSALVAAEDPEHYNPKLGRVVWCSTRGKADFVASDVRADRHKVSFQLSDGAHRVSCEVPVLGKHSVENLVLAAAVARELGMSMEEIAKALTSMPPELSQLHLRKGIKNLTLIDSTYSANVVGVIADLEYLKLWEDRERFVVMPSLIELGSESEKAHEMIGEKIAEVCQGAVICSRDGYPGILKGAKRKGMGADRILLRESVSSIEEAIDALTDPGDAVLLEGRVPSGLAERLSIESST